METEESIRRLSAEIQGRNNGSQSGSYTIMRSDSILNVEKIRLVIYLTQNIRQREKSRMTSQCLF